MDATKHLLTEVICAIRFNQTQQWDSTYFGIYFEKIKDYGYIEKQEQKGYQIVIDANKTNTLNPAATSEMDARFVFRNPQENRAIVLSKNNISFHQLAPYKDWNTLINEIATPALQKYYEMDLGGDIVQVQALYLNQYNLDINESLNNYLTFLPRFDPTIIEQNITFQSNYAVGSDKQLFLSLNGVINQPIGKKTVFLQCGCFVNATVETNFVELSQHAHNEANNLFNSITTK